MLPVEISVAFFIQRFGINELTIGDNDAPVALQLQTMNQCEK